MKASSILSVVFVVIFCCTSIAFSDNWKNESGNGRRGKPQSYQHHRDRHERSGHRDYRDDKKHRETSRRRDHQGRPDYHSHRGYRAHPYGNQRHYAHYVHRGHQYDYQGHWRSWDQWDRYAKAHPNIYKHGNYYREEAHLMFRFRDPLTGSYFFFSIGK